MALDKCEEMIVEDARRRRLAELEGINPWPPSYAEPPPLAQLLGDRAAWLEAEAFVAAERDALLSLPAIRLARRSPHACGALLEWRHRCWLLRGGNGGVE